MIIFGCIALAFMLFYAGYLFRCEYYFSRLGRGVLEGSEQFPENFPQTPPSPTDTNVQEPHLPGPKNQSPFISVIVPARNEAESIEACLGDLFRQSYPGDRYEIILVNDHSEDNTREIALQLASSHRDSVAGQN